MSIDGGSQTSIRVAAKPKKSKKSANRAGKWYWRWARKLFLPVTGLTAVFALYIWYDLPDITMISELKKNPSVVIKAEDGSIIGTYGDVYGDFIPYNQLPKHLVDAVVATEDRNFFHHFGVDPLGLLRAVYVNLKSRRLVQGGSTITQQLAKNAFLSPDRTLKRKIQEAILALELENRFSKKDILAMYLNRVYMGASSYGVDAASKRYFGKPVQEITLPEAAMLVGLLKAPTRYTPTTNPERSEKRATQVLLNMMDAGYLDQKEVDKAKKALGDEDAVYRDSGGFGLFYFNDYVMGQVAELLGADYKQDIVVETTLLPEVQKNGESAVSSVLGKKGVEMNAHQAALVSMANDGAIRAMVGGRNYRTSQFNRVTQALRQPGSAFKLFVFLAGLEAGYTPESEMEDKPITIGKWKPKDYAGHYKGMMTLRAAFAESINSIAVQLSETVGRTKVISMAQRLGISETIDPNPSLALGSSEVTLIELTKAYAHLASGGREVQPYAIRRIEDKNGKKLYQHSNRELLQLLSSDTVAMMNNMLMAVTTSGTGRGALIGRPVAGKTGTASDYRDAWFVGYVPQLVTGVWVGNDDTTPMKKVTGGALPASIFKQFMTPTLKGVEVADLPSQSGPSGGGITLPWTSSMPAAGGDSAPQQSPFAAVDGENTNDNEEPAQQYELPQSFWDKLLGE